MGNLYPDVIIASRCPRKSLSRRSRPRSFRDVLNVLLNAAIVSAAVHRAHKFSFCRIPHSFCRSVLIALKDKDRKEHVPPSFQRRRYTKILPASYSSVIGPFFFFFFRISIHEGTGKKSYISWDRGGIHMLRCLAEIPERSLRNELFDTRFYFTF